MLIWLKISLTMLLLSVVVGFLSPLSDKQPLSDKDKEKEIRDNMTYCVVYITLVVLTFVSWFGMFVAAIWFV